MIMRRISLLIMCLVTALAISCNKEPEQLSSLRQRIAELEDQEKELPDAAPAEQSDFKIEFGQEYIWVDAGSKTSVHYGLTKSGSVQATVDNGWSVTVHQSGQDGGELEIVAPDPASPSVVAVKATDGSGNVAETFIRVMVRNPYGEVKGPGIDVMAYNGFTDYLATPENFQKLVEAGVTMISVEGEDDVYGPGWRNQCRLAEAAGIKVVLFLGWTWQRYVVDPEHFTGLDELIKETLDYPAICAYQIIDEPDTYMAYSLAMAKTKINELAPGRPVYINLHPSSVSPAGMGATTYEEYVEFFANVCNLEFITFDQYPVFIWGVEDSWYRSLNTVYDTAKRHGIRFWAFIQSCWEHSRVDPSLETIRLQGNINLAYGAQCNQYFVWRATSGTNYAPIMSDGEYKQVYYDCKEYDRELHNREFVFANCDVRKVRHIGYNYYIHGSAFTNDDLPDAIGDLTVDDCALVSFIGNSGNDYVVVCNKAYDKKLKASLTFTRTVYTIDREGEFSEQQPGVKDFMIDEGDMLVIKYR